MAPVSASVMRGAQPGCTVDYRTGQKSGNCTDASAPAASSPSMPAASSAPPPPSIAPPPNITYNIGQPPPISIPGGSGDGTSSPIAPGAPPSQQPQSMISLSNQMKQPLDAINEDAMPSLRDGLGRRTPPSMAALFAQMARVY